MSFADDFRVMVVPRLKAATEAQGFLLGLDQTDFTDAHASVHVAASKRGAALLPDNVRADLDDWISASLLRESVKAEPRIDALAAEIEAAEIADPVRHYSGLAAASSDPARMKWVFAAISPEYRAYLLAERRRKHPIDFAQQNGALL